MEILVALLILVILLALTLSGVRGFIERNDRLRCVSNLRTIGIAINLYVQDHNGFLPGPSATLLSSHYNRVYLNAGSNAAFLLIPYLVGDFKVLGDADAYCETLVCPAAVRIMALEEKSGSRRCYSQSPTLYADNTQSEYPFGVRVGRWEVLQEPLKLQSIDQPGKTIAVGDRPTVPADPPAKPSMAHRNNRNFLFLDGHVRSFSRNQIQGNTRLVEQ